MEKKMSEYMHRDGKFKLVVIVAGILIVAIFSFAYYMGNKTRTLQGDYGENRLIPLEDQWEEMPEQTAGKVIYKYRVPSGENLMLSFTASSVPIDLFLGEEKLFHFENKQNINVRPAYFQELPGDSAGKELTMVVEGSASQGKSICDSAYIGSHRAVITYFLHRTIYTCIISVFLILLGGMLIMASIMLYVSKKQEDYGDMGFTYLGLFMVASGIWMLNDSQFLMLFTDRYWKLGLFSSVFFCFMPVFLTMYIQKILSGGGEQEQQGQYLKYLTLPHLAVMSLYMVLYAVGSPSLELTLPLEHTFIVITLGMCLWECMKNIRNTGNREIRKVVYGFGIFTLCCVFALVCFYFIPAIPYAGMYCLGFLIFSVILAYAAIQKLVTTVQTCAESETFQRLAYVDMMTGLGNRTAYMEACKSMEAPQICITLDINGLKTVNDTQGHQEGDELIKAAARSVKEAFSPLGHCFRVGGDEFVVTLEVRYQALLSKLMQSLREAVQKENAKRTFPLSMACGYAVPRDENDSFERVYHEADDKMYDVKRGMKKDFPGREDFQDGASGIKLENMAAMTEAYIQIGGVG